MSHLPNSLVPMPDEEYVLSSSPPRENVSVARFPPKVIATTASKVDSSVSDAEDRSQLYSVLFWNVMNAPVAMLKPSAVASIT